MSNSTQIKKIFLKKAGMTRIFDTSGTSVPVTVLEIISNKIAQVKSSAQDGYSAVQIAIGEKPLEDGIKSKQGHASKWGLSTCPIKLREIRLPSDPTVLPGSDVVISELVKAGSLVSVTGESKGKGFQGVVKRYGFAGGPASHGSHFHRRPGSIGNRATPARVFPQKKMPGRMGCEVVTVKNVKIVDVNSESGFILVRGSVPGAVNSIVTITLS